MKSVTSGTTSDPGRDPRFGFEWAFGFSRRFGIVYVDFETLERVPKDSFKRYRDFIAAHRATSA